MQNTQMLELLKKALSDTYALYLKTQNYHWNIEGSNFYQLHLLLEEHYKELAENVDQIAEMIRTYKIKAPGTFEEFQKLTSIKPANPNFTDKQMLADLCDSHLTLQTSLITTLHEAQRNQDEVLADLMIQKLHFHKKAVWMLEASCK